MKIPAEQTQPELLNLQPLGRIQSAGSITIAPPECADDAPC
jgi:hypothetical protein